MVENIDVIDKITGNCYLEPEAETDDEFVIPDGETWVLTEFGGGSDGECLSQLKYSADGGTTWTNPFGNLCDSIRGVFTNGDSFKTPFTTSSTEGYHFVGDGANIVLRLSVINLSTTDAIKAACWMRGFIE